MTHIYLLEKLFKSCKYIFFNSLSCVIKPVSLSHLFAMGCFHLMILSLTILMTLIEGDPQILTKFWELEEIQTTQNEQFVEEHYQTNTPRNQDGFNQHVEN